MCSFQPFESLYGLCYMFTGTHGWSHPSYITLVKMSVIISQHMKCIKWLFMLKWLKQLLPVKNVLHNSSSFYDTSINKAKRKKKTLW